MAISQGTRDLIEAASQADDAVDVARTDVAQKRQTTADAQAAQAASELELDARMIDRDQKKGAAFDALIAELGD